MSNGTVGFLGQIEDARTYNRALTAEEIARLHSAYEVRENRTLAFVVSAADPLGNPITYAASGLPTGASFDAKTQTFRWTPWYNQAGDHVVRFTASGQNPQEVTVSVQDVEMQDWYKAFLQQVGKL